MNQEYVIEEFKSVLPKEFKIKLIEKKYIRAFWIQENISFSLFLGNSQDLMMKNIVSSIEYKVIEELYDPKFKLGKGNYTIDDSLLKTLFKLEISDQLKKSLPISLATEEGVSQACELIKIYYEQVAVPFFNYFKDVRALLPFIEKSGVEYLRDIFTSSGIEKKAIIWKLFKHPNYSEYIEDVVKIYQDAIQKMPHIGSFKESLALIEKIEDVKPIYNWDDIYLIAKPFNI